MTATGASPHILFDRALLRARRRRAAPRLAQHGFLLERSSEDIAARLSGIERHFPLVLLQDVRGGYQERALDRHPRIGAVLRSASDPATRPDVVADEEALPFAPGRFDAVLSLLGLHWVNDLPGALLQICQILKPDGLFIGSFFGGDTLIELRTALAQAESEIEEGLSPRIAPFADIQAAAGLLQRAGFALPVTDRDDVTVTYETPLHLMQELRGMGETNMLIERRRIPLRRATLARAAEIYAERFSTPQGRIKATFEILTMTGWRPRD